jgi:hypothetical protein
MAVKTNTVSDAIISDKLDEAFHLIVCGIKETQMTW